MENSCLHDNLWYVKTGVVCGNCGQTWASSKEAWQAQPSKPVRMEPVIRPTHTSKGAGQDSDRPDRINQQFT